MHVAGQHQQLSVASVKVFRHLLFLVLKIFVQKILHTSPVQPGSIHGSTLGKRRCLCPSPQKYPICFARQVSLRSLHNCNISTVAES